MYVATLIFLLAPLVSDVTVRRSEERNDTFHVTATLNYTGGGAIELFVVSYRKIRTTATWIPLDRNFTATPSDSQLLWSANIVDDNFQYSGIELRIKVVNSYGHASNYVDQREQIGKSFLSSYRPANSNIIAT